MGAYVSPDMIRAARKADLYQFLSTRHPNDVEINGDSLRLCTNPSLSVKRGHAGWKDWATNNTGNGIDLLETYFGYDFQTAVVALAGMSPAPPPVQMAPRKAAATGRRPFILPPPFQGAYRQLYSYLTKTRGISRNLVQSLIDAGLLYQTANYGNMVFVSGDRHFAEICGSNSNKPFHQVKFDPNHPEAYWSFHTPVTTGYPEAYICEDSIDAISLYLLHQATGPKRNAIYCAIAGVANQARIDNIKRATAIAGGTTIMAVNDDDAGRDCRRRNSDCQSIIPKHKDWNEDWLFLQKRGK